MIAHIWGNWDANGKTSDINYLMLKCNRYASIEISLEIFVNEYSDLDSELISIRAYPSMINTESTYLSVTKVGKLNVWVRKDNT